MALLGAVVLTTFGGGMAQAKGPASDDPVFIFQDVTLAPFERSTTYVVVGERVPDGCAYTYPDFTVPADVERWQIRDLGIDPKRCVKLVEEGVPTDDEVSEADSSLTAVIDTSSAPSTESAAGVAAVTPASGFAHAWFENFLGQTLTSDTTYLTWAYNGSCVVDGNSSGQWSWNSVYFSIVSYSGTGNLTCARYFGDTWSTFRNNLNGSCYHYFYHVRAYGWWDGDFTASRSDYANCGPVWEHFDYRRTT
jgi:hypothetical protein